jgi:hypothetical protein
MRILSLALRAWLTETPFRLLDRLPFFFKVTAPGGYADEVYQCSRNYIPLISLGIAAPLAAQTLRTWLR